MQQRDNHKAWEGESRSGGRGFSSARYSYHHVSNTGTVQISEEVDLFKNLLERVWLVFLFQCFIITIRFSLLLLSQPAPRI